MNPLVNVAAYQVLWFSLVLGAAELSAPLAPTLFLIAIGWAAFLLLVRLPTIPQRESVPV